jgi:5-methyltetrahydropteroyltriglutamate--homocysteine methyltransferase
MTQQAQDDFYADEARLAMDFATAVNAELRDLQAAGADVLQIDEPYLQARAEKARQYAIPAINRALEGISLTTVLHTCFGYGLVVKNKQVGAGYPFLSELRDVNVDQISIEAAQPRLDLSALEALDNKTIMLGVLDLGTTDVETPEVVEERIRAGLQYIPPERLVLAPDCGMKYLPRDVAFEKLRAMSRAAEKVRDSLGVPA